MFSKINVFGIIINHIKTYKKYGSEEISKRECFLHLALPMLVGAALGYWMPFKPEASSILITVHSILIGFFLSVIALLFNVLEKLEANRKTVSKMENPNINDNKRVLWLEDLVIEVFTNISFAILVSIVSVLILLTLYLKNDISLLLSFLSNCFLIFLKSIHVFLNCVAWTLLFIQGNLILMILRRMHTIFTEQISDIRKIPLKKI